MATHPFIPYSIPIFGLKEGIHHFKFQLGGDFFSHFEDSPVQKADINFDVKMDKRADLLLFDFVLNGVVESVCDRCTADVDLSVQDQQQLVVKYGEETLENDEVVFIPHEDSTFNLAKYLYEFSIMALPLINTYNCQDDKNPPCNFDVLKHISGEDEIKEEPNSIWDSLNDLKNNN